MPKLPAKKVSYYCTAEFNSSDAAEMYGATIDSIALSDDSKVLAGENGNLESIFVLDPSTPKRHKDKENLTYHSIRMKVDAGNDKVSYEVSHIIKSPNDASFTDMYRTIPAVEAELTDKLHELGGRNTTGRWQG